MGVFYVLTVLNLLTRMIYFAQGFFINRCYVEIVLSVIPSSFSASIGISQFMNYIVLSIRLDMYLQSRESGTRMPDAEERGHLLEIWTLIISTIFIVLIPVSLTA